MTSRDGPERWTSLGRGALLIMRRLRPQLLRGRAPRTFGGPPTAPARPGGVGHRLGQDRPAAGAASARRPPSIHGLDLFGRDQLLLGHVLAWAWMAVQALAGVLVGGGHGLQLLAQSWVHGAHGATLSLSGIFVGCVLAGPARDDQLWGLWDSAPAGVPDDCP